MALTPEERSLRATMAAHSKWAKTGDRSEETAAGRAAFELRFYREVDPDNTLDPAEREKRAANARRAYFARLAFKSAVARRKRAAQAQPAAEAGEAAAS
ncbi:hypothetical protein amrb99_37130 [Actinomadura sp. RB99]|uniref:hypothetical protein n=1 Tax=Actinomadura sp. RB99 TaxID=2691577 RepID=UPI0019A756C4|nr:hypothetical protein [Actinomadura sp. RB99]MBD2894785.1 hypothetical protein [Actinomadura sp. RB99]